MILDRSGLTDGERINSCSTMAQLYFPRFLCISNGFGRLRLDYRDLCAQMFPRWPDYEIPKPEALMGYIREYSEHHLLFVYTNSGQTWGQWDAKHGTFGKYHTAEDKRSPAPPEDAWKKWIDGNRQNSVRTSEVLVEFNLIPVPENLPEGPEKLEEFFDNVSANFPRGIGVGIGDGVTCLENGEGIKPSARKACGPISRASQLSAGTAESKHKRIEQMVKSAWESHNPGAGLCPWGPDDGMQLKVLLRKTGTWPDSNYAQCLANIYQTEGFPRSELPVRFLPRLASFFSGPRNVYNREVNGNAQHQGNSGHSANGYKSRAAASGGAYHSDRPVTERKPDFEVT